MPKDLFPVKLLLKPAEVFAEIAAGRAGWGWPLALYAASVASSAAMLRWLPPQFLAEVSGGAGPSAGHGFGWYLAVGLPGGLAFNLLFSACLCLFLPFVKAGRLPYRLAALALGTGAYGFFFLLPFAGQAFYAAKWLAVLLALTLTVRAATARPAVCRSVFHTLLALSLLTLGAEAAGALAALAGSANAYLTGQLAFAGAALVYLGKAGAQYFETTTAKASVAALAAMIAALVFFSSLGAIGLLSKDLMEAMLMI